MLFNLLLFDLEKGLLPYNGLEIFLLYKYNFQGILYTYIFFINSKKKFILIIFVNTLLDRTITLVLREFEERTVSFFPNPCRSLDKGLAPFERALVLKGPRYLKSSAYYVAISSVVRLFNCTNPIPIS